MRHTIKKGIFDVRVDRQLDAFVLQETISNHFVADLLPAMDAAFNEISQEGHTISIDVLELDLGRLSPEMIESGEWVMVFQEVLQKKLEEALGDWSVQSEGRVRPQFENSFAQWMYLMEHGLLPWNAAPPSEDWQAQVLEALARSFASAVELRELILHQRAAVQRVVWQHDAVFLSHLVELLTAEKQTGLPKVILETARWIRVLANERSLDSTSSEQEMVQNLWKEVLQKSARPATGITTQALVRHLFIEWLECTPVEIRELAKVHPVAKKYPLLQPVIKDIIREADKQEKPDPASANESNKKPTPQPGKQIKKKEKELLSSPASPIDKSNKESALSLHQKLSPVVKKESIAPEEFIPNHLTQIAEEGLYINHAGLVLLHPFLSVFFKKLGLVAGGQFIDTESQQRALLLLHELVDSDAPCYEYNLVLAKLLCNWPLQMPVDTSMECTPEEKEEAQALLGAAIAQWEVLKNTSPAALQQMFLQREGRLDNRNGWHLHVEKTAVDILLSQLPWNLGIIRLPWMKELLRVVWV